jgi:hypothetical protein
LSSELSREDGFVEQAGELGHERFVVVQRTAHLVKNGMRQLMPERVGKLLALERAARVVAVRDDVDVLGVVVDLTNRESLPRFGALVDAVQLLADFDLLWYFLTVLSPFRPST